MEEVCEWKGNTEIEIEMGEKEEREDSLCTE
jgi:hypothetical protein